MAADRRHEREGGPDSGASEGSVFDAGSRAERRRQERFDRTRRPRMAELSNAVPALHRAAAEAEVAMAQETLSAILDGTIAKGDVLSVAELAGVMAGKRAADLIPLAHPAALTGLTVNASPDRAAGAIRVRAEAAAMTQSGVEMEALTAAAVAALTVYDMVRDLEPGAWVRSLRLLESSADGSVEWRRAAEPQRAVPPARGVRAAGRINPGVHGTYRPGVRRRTP